MSSLGIFNKETKTYQKVAGTAEAAVVDAEMSDTSTNPVQNKVVKAYVDKKASEGVDFSTSTSKLLNDTVEAPLVLSNATRNLLNPTLQTTTQNGVTCTNNGDGTYTLNGTASHRAIFTVCDENYHELSYFAGNAKIIKQIFSEQSVPGSDGSYSNGYYFAMQGKDKISNIYIDEIVVDDYVDKTYRPIINVSKGITVNNVTIKPMITTDLNATYDDFVPYSGYDIKTCGKNIVGNPSDRNNPTVKDGIITFPSKSAADHDTYLRLYSDVDISAFNTFRVVVESINCTINDGNKTYVIIKTAGKKEFSTYFDTGFESSTNKYISNVFNCSDFGNKIAEITVVIKRGYAYPGGSYKISVFNGEDKEFSNWEPYVESSVHIDSSTEFPLLGLKSFDGETNIISPCNVEVTYAKSDSGAAILDTSEKSVKDSRKETTVNLLNPTLQTITQSGITCTNNGDGTYTLNGTTTSSRAGFNLIGKEGGNSVWLTMPADGKIIFATEDVASRITCAAFKSEDGATMYAGGIIPEGTNIRNIYIAVWENQTLDNVIIKPMLTTNLSATYDDFVPYTGDTGRLNGDVAALKAEIANNRTTVDAAMSDTSTNPVQNKVVKKYVDDHAPNITVDAAMSDTSTNPVQNKVITGNLNDIKKETTVNLLNPTLETTTHHGITCTHNGDGTYTLNGTATSAYVVFTIQGFADTLKEHLNEELLLVGCPKYDESINMTLHLNNGKYHAADSGNGAKFNMSETVGSYVPITIEIGTNGATVNNLVFKPMITTNLNATYDDFVPYTGDTGKLNSDVAVLSKKIPTFVRNDSVFYSTAGHSPVITGDTAGRFSAISDEWSDDKGRVIKFKNDMDTKTHITIYANVPVHNALFLQAYSPSGASVEVKSPLFFYTKSSDDNPVQTIACDVTAPVGTEVSIAFNPIIIKNV